MLSLGSCNPTNTTEPEMKEPSIVGVWTCSDIELTQEGLTMTMPAALIGECIVFSFEENGTGSMGVYYEGAINEEAAITSYELGADGTINIVSPMGADGTMSGKYLFEGEDNLRLEFYATSDEDYDVLALNLLRGLHPEVLLPQGEEELPAPSPTDPVKNTIWLLTAYGITSEGSEIKIPAEVVNGGDILEIHFGADGTGEVCTIVSVMGETIHETSPFDYAYNPEDGMMHIFESGFEQEQMRVVREENNLRLIAEVDGERQTMYFELIDKCSAEL